MLRGARLVTAREVQEGRSWNEARIKQAPRDGERRTRRWDDLQR